MGRSRKSDPVVHADDEDDDEELSPVADDDDDDDGTKQSRQLQFKQALHKVNAGELLKRLKVRHRVSC